MSPDSAFMGIPNQGRRRYRPPSAPRRRRACRARRLPPYPCHLPPTRQGAVHLTVLREPRHACLRRASASPRVAGVAPRGACTLGWGSVARVGSTGVSLSVNTCCVCCKRRFPWQRVGCVRLVLRKKALWRGMRGEGADKIIKVRYVYSLVFRTHRS